MPEQEQFRARYSSTLESLGKRLEDVKDPDERARTAWSFYRAEIDALETPTYDVTVPREWHRLFNYTLTQLTASEKPSERRFSLSELLRAERQEYATEFTLAMAAQQQATAQQQQDRQHQPRQQRAAEPAQRQAQQAQPQRQEERQEIRIVAPDQYGMPYFVYQALERQIAPHVKNGKIKVERGRFEGWRGEGRSFQRIVQGDPEVVAAIRDAAIQTRDNIYNSRAVGRVPPQYRHGGQPQAQPQPAQQQANVYRRDMDTWANYGGRQPPRNQNPPQGGAPPVAPAPQAPAPQPAPPAQGPAQPANAAQATIAGVQTLSRQYKGGKVTAHPTDNVDWEISLPEKISNYLERIFTKRRVVFDYSPVADGTLRVDFGYADSSKGFGFYRNLIIPGLKQAGIPIVRNKKIAKGNRFSASIGLEYTQENKEKVVRTLNVLRKLAKKGEPVKADDAKLAVQRALDTRPINEYLKELFYREPAIEVKALPDPATFRQRLDADGISYIPTA